LDSDFYFLEPFLRNYTKILIPETVIIGNSKMTAYAPTEYDCKGKKISTVIAGNPEGFSTLFLNSAQAV
jgi:hypothetical protein